MNFTLSHDQSEAVFRGEAVRVATAEGRNLIVISEQVWNEDLARLTELELDQVTKIGRRAISSWAKENPF